MVRNSFMRLALLPVRLRTALSYYWVPIKQIASWLITSKENTNFSYNLTELNEHYLACFVAEVTGASMDTVHGYIQEIKGDSNLIEHISSMIRESKWRYKADEQPKWGRRIGWYALIRITKPRVVVETGVDKGLGSCVIAAALQKNDEDGYPGFLYGTDINLNAGYLLESPYDKYGEILYGDSIMSLERLDENIDLFINDSDHSVDYEMREYLTISEKLSDSALIVGDNSHFSDKLLNFANETGRRFLFFQEQPIAHWYPGGGIGIAFSDASRVRAQRDVF